MYARISEGEFPKHTQTRGKKHYWTRTAVQGWLNARRVGKTAAASVAAPAPAQANTCGNCADNKRLGRQCFCRSEGLENLHRNTMVTPTGTCEWHRKPGTYRPVRLDEED